MARPRIDISSGTKLCTKCKIILPIENFTLRNSGRDLGLHLSACKSCISKKSKEYRLEYPDRVKTTNESRKDLTKITRAKYRIKNSNHEKLVTKLWRQNNMPIVNSNTARRRSKKLNATPNWVNFEYIKLFYSMSKEAELETGIKHNVDHIVPLQSDYVCGLHCEDNLQVLSNIFNLSKGNRIWPSMVVIDNELKQLAKEFYGTY